MKTIQTAPGFIESKQKFVDYTADVTTALPKILEIGDSVDVVITAIGTGAQVALTLGSVDLLDTETFSPTNGDKYRVNISVTKIASSTFLVITDVVTYYIVTDTTNDYTANNITVNLTPVQATGKHIMVGS